MLRNVKTLSCHTLLSVAALWAAFVFAQHAYAGVLPEDRGDLLYHRFDGGGVKVDGPSLLVRKKIGEQVSLSANYYVDLVTSASIDVLTSGASQYKEKRTQVSGGAEYLRGKTTYSLNYINSKESDYKANTVSIGVSEDMFGDLTTVSLGYSRAWDQVAKNVKKDGVLINDVEFGQKPVDHRSYRLGLSQIITKRLIMGLNYESQTHEGYLQNPYRSYDYLLGTLRASKAELYPGTRTTNAIALDARYYLWYRASVHGSYRYFTDTWGIGAHTAELGYVHPKGAWTFEGSYRYHRQNSADFYSDLFPRANSQNFLARDRNLASMNNQGIHLGVSYEMSGPWHWIQKSSANLYFDHLQYNFENFRDARMSNTGVHYTDTPVPVGQEPLYKETSNVVQFFISVFY